MKYIGTLVILLSFCLVAPGCGGSTETSVIEASGNELAELEAQMNADEAAASAAMEAGLEGEEAAAPAE